jgi:hypothetical protein
MEGIFDQLVKMFWERSEIMFLTADLITQLRYLDRRQFQKEGLSDNAFLHKTLWYHKVL